MSIILRHNLSCEVLLWRLLLWKVLFSVPERSTWRSRNKSSLDRSSVSSRWSWSRVVWDFWCVSNSPLAILLAYFNVSLIKHAKAMKSGAANSVGDHNIKNSGFYWKGHEYWTISHLWLFVTRAWWNFRCLNPFLLLFPYQVGGTAQALLTLTWSRTISLLRPTTSSWSCAVLHPWSSTPACQTWKSWDTKQRTFLHISI